MTYHKPIIIALMSIIGIVESTIPFAIALFFSIILDCYSAYDLSRRLKKKYPNRVTGKFKSEYALKMLKTLLEMYGVIVVISVVEHLTLPMHDFDIANWACWLCCLIQMWSVLENFSSENSNGWALVLQKIMVNKAKRHFDIDLNELKNNTDNGENGAT